MSDTPELLAVVIPAYRVADQILAVLADIGTEVGLIYVVDDACPQGSGAIVHEHCSDPRVKVLLHPKTLALEGRTQWYASSLKRRCKSNYQA